MLLCCHDYKFSTVRCFDFAFEVSIMLGWFCLPKCKFNSLKWKSFAGGVPCTHPVPFILYYIKENKNDKLRRPISRNNIQQKEPKNQKHKQAPRLNWIDKRVALREFWMRKRNKKAPNSFFSFFYNICSLIYSFESFDQQLDVTRLAWSYWIQNKYDYWYVPFFFPKPCTSLLQRAKWNISSVLNWVNFTEK